MLKEDLCIFEFRGNREADIVGLFGFDAFFPGDFCGHNDGEFEEVGMFRLKDFIKGSILVEYNDTTEMLLAEVIIVHVFFKDAERLGWFRE